jgi:hypothetical protein
MTKNTRDDKKITLRMTNQMVDAANEIYDSIRILAHPTDRFFELVWPDTSQSQNQSKWLRTSQ